MVNRIYVIGSMSMDLVTQAVKAPSKGETILGTHFFMSTGGKGANQAVAAARLGSEVHMVGCVGDDDFGQKILRNLAENHVAIDTVDTIAGCASGTASITLVDGDNSIIVVPSANFEVSVEQVERVLKQMNDDDIVLLQNEIPASVIEYVIKECAKRNIRVIYNPAPFIKIDKALLDLVTYFTPNETEVIELFGQDYEEVVQHYPRKMIVTLGEKGAVYYDDELKHIPAVANDVVDTTGAGDTFNGALAVAINEGKSLSEAVEFANKAAGLSVTALGAQGGMPYKEEM